MARPANSDDPYGSTIVSKTHDDTYPFINPERGTATSLKVLVTGASKGIGRATVISFARAGASSIAMLARSDMDNVAEDVSRAAKAAVYEVPKILKLSADMSDPGAIGKAVEIVKQEFGYLDVVINNASRLENWASLADTNVDEWWLTWEVNLKGTYIVSRATLPLLLQGAGAFVSLPGASACQGSKTAQIRLNDFLLSEYGDQGLIAFAIHPAGAKTESALKMPEDSHHYLTQTPELAADTIVWMTRERRQWLSGRFVYGPVDMEELLAKKDEIVQKDLLKVKLTV
ncbi:hypothetical protein M409DRAFT_65517 [Zasmidium cellare ATCC 36951]|uniref:Uncharacterized protein n=1 Tax=Zasmidium cellare ATCC 36951 TaxID=1080233 RepID=A0A6A6CMZ8_ZASCE|nr:uncharacterized protein M409DRAFT_65517 [Zasmidium cellare ATCC 36951]KAF2168627.1 hypothetical protein M409DRAFT_65517 [Zasmidium cellare ATCC 36951]